MRSPLVIASLGLHLVVASGLLVAGLWRIERLDPGRRTVDIAVAPSPPPAPSGSPVAAAHEPFKRKQRTVTRTLVQPTRIDPETRPVQTPASEAGQGTGGTGTGPGAGSGSDPEGTGTCTEPPCGDGPPVAEARPPVVETPRLVAPTVIKGLRTSGETQIHPPAPVKTAILRDGKSRVTATLRVCVGTAGEVASLSLVKSSGYPGYDQALQAGLAAWRYRPYEIDGRRVPVCGMVTFIYAIQ